MSVIPNLDMYQTVALDPRLIKEPVVTEEQAAAMKGKKCLIISHHQFSQKGMAGSGIKWMIWVTAFMHKYGVEIYFASPKMPAGERSMVEWQVAELKGVMGLPGGYDVLVEVEGFAEDNLAENIAKAVNNMGVKIDAVFTHTENLQPVVGQLCELLQIPNNPYTAYEKARDKYKTRVALHEAGLAAPKACKLKNLDDIEDVLSKVPLPMVVKPTSGAGSMGVYKAFSEEELRDSLARALEDLSVTDSVLSYAPGVEIDAPIVCEELLIAKDWEDYPIGEFDVDVVVWDGKLVYGTVTDNWKPIPPYFLENGTNHPSVIPESAQKELLAYSEKVVAALGFYKGAFHVECMYTDKHGPVLLECNPRVGGGPIRYFNNLLNGVELISEFIITALDVPTHPIMLKDAPEGSMVVYYLCCPLTGELLDADFMDEVRELPGVHSATPWAKAGDQVKGYDTQVPQWIGEIVIHGPKGKVGEMIKLMEQAVEIATKSVNVRTKADVAVAPNRRVSENLIRRSSIIKLPVEQADEQFPQSTNDE